MSVRKSTIEGKKSACSIDGNSAKSQWSSGWMLRCQIALGNILYIVQPRWFVFVERSTARKSEAAAAIGELASFDEHSSCMSHSFTANHRQLRRLCEACGLSGSAFSLAARFITCAQGTKSHQSFYNTAHSLTFPILQSCIFLGFM